MNLLHYKFSKLNLILHLNVKFHLNKNYLLRFDGSIISSSVKSNFPFLEQQMPINANIFKYSQPKAPAPTKNKLIITNFY